MRKIQLNCSFGLGVRGVKNAIAVRAAVLPVTTTPITMLRRLATEKEDVEGGGGVGRGVS